MKRLELILKPLSPFMVGGRKLGNNLNRSLPYIPGGVIRSALALQILRQCPYFDEKLSSNGKQFWVEFKDGKDCGSCRWRDLCKHFSNITFGNAYPAGGKPYPLTAMKCKYNRHHQSVDTLINDIHWTLQKDYVRLKVQCPQCSKRLEKCSGFYIVDGGKEKSIGQRRQLLIKGGIDYATKTNNDGRLYALETVTPAGNMIWHEQGRDKGEDIDAMDYRATVLVPDGVEFPPLGRLSVGGESHSGLGLMEASVNKVERRPNLIERIKKFNAALNADDGVYIALMAMSPMLLGLEKGFAGVQAPSDLSQDEFKERMEAVFSGCLQDKIGYPLKLVMGFAEYEWLRGFDTSVPVGQDGHLRRAALYATMGSVYVFKTADLTDKLVKGLERLEQEGLGYRTADGYGSISICDEYHIRNNAEGVIEHDR